MINHMIHSAMGAGAALLKRGSEDAQQSGNAVFPAWAYLVFLIEILVLLPFLVFNTYTLGWVYPTLAMVSMPSPAAYKPLALHDGDLPVPESMARKAEADGAAKLSTTSLRHMSRLLYSLGGWRASFRGLDIVLVLNLATALVVNMPDNILPVVPRDIYGLIVALCLVQVSAAWTHAVIRSPDSPTSSLSFFSRITLPPFKRTLEATALPVTVYWLASTLVGSVPRHVARLLELPLWERHNPLAVPDGHIIQGAGEGVWKVILLMLCSFLVEAVVLVPALVALTRIQASLLPEDDDAIVCFDRSFGGRVHSAIVGGTGYATMRDALASFGCAAWARLYLMYAKIFALGLVLSMMAMAVFVPELFIFARRGLEADL